MQNLVEIHFHGDLGEKVGAFWKAAVNSVSEAIRSVEINSKRKLYKYLLEKDKEGVKYQILINKRPFISAEPLDINQPETLKTSELTIKNKSLKTIDIVPIIEGADEGTLGIILGVLLIIVSFFIPGSQAILIPAGLGLIAAGIMTLLSSPPKFEDFREIDGSTGRTSYLFNGPQNTTQEGGPVPVGYGRLLVGSQVVSASYIISDYSIGTIQYPTVFPGQYGGGGGGSAGKVIYEH